MSYISERLNKDNNVKRQIEEFLKSEGFSKGYTANEWSYRVENSNEMVVLAVYVDVEHCQILGNAPFEKHPEVAAEFYDKDSFDDFMKRYTQVVDTLEGLR